MGGRGLRITLDGLEEMGADLSRLGRNGIRDAINQSLRGEGGEALATEMKLRAPRRTGRLHSGIGVHVGARSKGHLSDVEVGYVGELSHGNKGGGRFQLGAWIESGTKPHEIRARDGGSLVLGGNHFEKVDHPGSRPQRVASKSIRAAEWEVLADVVDKINASLTYGHGGG